MQLKFKTTALNVPRRNARLYTPILRKAARRSAAGFKVLALSSVLLLGMSGCQSLIPKAKGLSSSTWTAQSYQRQDLVEVFWKQQSFSFLLYQQQHAENLELLALSLTGQQLFKLQFDGQSVNVEQRIEQMKLLPFDFVVRDILFATYPKFTAQADAQVERKHVDAHTEIWIQQQPVLNIEQTAESLQLENLQVPYRMLFSPVSNTLVDEDPEDIRSEESPSS